ncbi:3-demethylubiquinone-9 3-methyltransferase [Anseongella ginsenosidimutans]|uniref:3-demethylubiquinone-9 3-methyltransferase n=1 Tax=Anseongella ginsenosidimutans TaxID=496056 RepID=A0A4R3KVR3_9SPHI|nr:bifunctional 2-polyprenyl-6-hydroxyphenol methylase/3-demethylubiquinol 3-O-methyltransferase UbiG [Anseongella ginsenosidimutans]QEC51882.1 3-demethylubiquinone-9 3-O-methyltransferase [Anseongella ginsenosidimutans]TCS89268.1 3-demethylubiquinone-9 3-methyltransferase [Anseongella ginsenosidimutans]
MEKIDQEVYGRINNDVYQTQGDTWWKPDSILHLLKTSINPWRVGYAAKVLKKLDIDPQGKTALEVGSGGGILTEEICKMGFTTSGIEPAEESLHAARNHANAEGLAITYEKGSGEQIPFPDQSFDCVFCCDVLEHVRDLPKVISEISRVLKPRGVFIYDTLNRTFISKMVAIKIWQEWKRWAFMPPNLHVWKMFIKPGEIKDLLTQNGFEWREHVGSEPNVPLPKMLGYLRKRTKGEWTYADLGKNFRLVESKDMNILYGGYAIKK